MNLRAARGHLATARTMIDEMGYHRRDKDVRKIEEALVQTSSPLDPSLRWGDGL